MDDVNPLREFFESHQGPQVTKWTHYFEIYHRHLARFRDRPIRFLELGVNQGGSLQMWASYLHPDSRIVGVDIDDRCRQFASGNIDIEIGDQGNRDFLRALTDQHGPFEVVVDDGGHRMRQQVATLEELFPHMTDDGCFLVEDVHTSYLQAYGGAFRRRRTLIEHAKRRVDQLHAWWSETENLTVDDITRSTASIHFYPMVVVFERSPQEPPESRKRGDPVFDLTDREARQKATRGATGAH